MVTTLATGVLVVADRQHHLREPRTSYKAIFTDATGVVKGDDIRIAGVKVGSVKSVEIVDRTRARVTFTVRDATAVTRARPATIRYRNLVGQRYISVTQGVGDTARMPDGSTIPLGRTQPALDLTTLFNGFKPLFAALTPADVNKLSYELIQVFQGEGSNLEGLLRSTGSVTQTLADRDQLIGDVITNLNTMLNTIGDRDQQLSAADHEVPPFMAGLDQDKDAILNSLDSSPRSPETADIITGIRPGLRLETSSSCARSRRTSTRAATRSTGRCRSCRSSWRRSAGPRSTARGSTSTSASSRPRYLPERPAAVPYRPTRRGNGGATSR